MQYQCPGGSLTYLPKLDGPNWQKYVVLQLCKLEFQNYVVRINSKYYEEESAPWLFPSSWLPGCKSWLVEKLPCIFRSSFLYWCLSLCSNFRFLKLTTYNELRIIIMASSSLRHLQRPYFQINSCNGSWELGL